MKQLEQVLTEMNEEQLRHVYQLWMMGDLNKTRSKTLLKRIPELIEHTKDAVAARFVWDQLSSDQQYVFNRLVGVEARKGIPYERLLRKEGWDEARLRTTVQSLVDMALIGEETKKTGVKTEKNSKLEQETTLFFPFKENAILLYNVTREVQVSRTEYGHLRLDEFLETLLLIQLQAILGKNGIGYYSYMSREQSMMTIHQMLLEPEVVYEIISKLDTHARDLFTWLCEGQGTISIQQVRERTGFDNETLFKMIHSLTDSALAFDRLTDQGRSLFIPKDTFEPLKKALVLLKAPPPELGLVIAETPPVILESKPLIQYDLAVIIGAAYQQSLEPTQAGYVPKRFAAKIQPLLHGIPRYSYNDEDQYMEMLFEITRELQLLQLSTPILQDIKPRYEEGKALAEWGQLSLVEQTRRLLAQWTKSFRWLDIVPEDYRQYDPYNWSPLSARSIIQKYLQDCTPGRWYRTVSLLETIWQEEPLALRKSQFNTGYYDIYNSLTPLKQTSVKGPSGRARWMSSDAQIYFATLTSSLFELGIVTIGGEELPAEEVQPEGLPTVIPHSFMVTELGAAALASTTEAQPTTSQALVVQPNFELLLLSPDMSTLYHLLPFTQVKQIELVSTLTLTRNSVLRGLANGKTVEQILDTLHTYSQKELPQNVEYSIRDWTKQYKGLRLTQTILLEVSDEALTDELCGSKTFKNFGLRKVGPLAIAASGDINNLRRALDKEGINVNISGTGSVKHDFTYGMRR